MEFPAVLDLAGGEKEFNNREIGYSFFSLFLSSLGHSVHEEKEDEEHDHQSVLVKLCGRKVVKFMALSYLPSYGSFMPDLHLSHPDSCGSLFTQRWRKQGSG